MTRSGLTIGEFSRITHLSIRTLRRYHEAGLLEPAAVDPASGYRSYALDQVPQAQVIHRFRQLDMPLADVRALLATDDPDRRTALVTVHLDRLERELDRTRGAVAALRRLLEPAAPPAVSVRRTPSLRVEAVRARVRHDEVLQWYADAMASLADVPRSGPPGGLYDHELFTDGVGEALVYVPTDAGKLTLPAREVAVVTHPGPHDGIDVSYAVLGSHVAEHEIGVAGPVQEVYLVGPGDDPDPAAWRTELAWPVFRT
ncbi:MerR family transcriptional regulator [Nocardioides sp. W7]|uniref:MerR family transcriptional regulator n=1 Tax=Nocardioides sp. W7 TaxID=2931390 RepID=UPI001FD2A961|nr:MerR family transcriptional regulator [Nocardioides sp. W7]